MSQEGYESSSSSEGEGEFGLSSYMFEPKRTPAEVENLLKELELKQNSPQDDCPPRNTRIGNIDLCVCSETCEAMVTETESLCCNRLVFSRFLDLRENLGIVKGKLTRKTCFPREKKHLAPRIYQAKFCLAVFL